MAFTHTLLLALSGGGNAPSSSVSITADSKHSIDVTLTANQSNCEVDCDFVSTRLKSIYILSDYNLTVKTNSSGSPDDTLTIVAGEAFVWNSKMPWANPFVDADVAKLFLTNGNSSTANRVQIEILYDSTP